MAGGRGLTRTRWQDEDLPELDGRKKGLTSTRWREAENLPAPEGGRRRRTYQHDNNVGISVVPQLPQPSLNILPVTEET